MKVISQRSLKITLLKTIISEKLKKKKPALKKKGNKISAERILTVAFKLIKI